MSWHVAARPSGSSLAPALVAALLLVLAPQGARAHPIHTTLTRVAPSGDSATVTVRAFVDDFSAAVARFAGKPVPADSSAVRADVDRYIAARLRIADRRGRPVALRPCGVRREGGVYWICLRMPWRRGGSDFVMRNTILGDLHADQVNVVQVEAGRSRNVVLFTASSGEKALVR